MRKLDYFNIFVLIGLPVSLVILGVNYFKVNDLSLNFVILFISSYSLYMISINAGYHRLFSHGSYEAHSVVQFVLLLIGSGAMQGSAKQWVSDHQYHHNELDTENDPHNALNGFWYAHMGWLFYKNERALITPLKIRKDIVNWQHTNYRFLATGVGILVPTAIGYVLNLSYGGMVAGLLAIVVSQQSTFLGNSLSHYIGKKPYQNNSATDNTLANILTFGEGFHNYHHKFPVDYTAGSRWYNFDPSKWLINLLSHVGLTRNLKQTKKAQKLDLKKSIMIEARKIFLTSQKAYEIKSGKKVSTWQMLKNRDNNERKKI